MKAEAISRRELFARLVGRRRDEAEAAAAAEVEPDAPPSLVEQYLALLDRHRDALPFGVAESDLPESREAIKTAILSALPAEAHPALREVLRDGYASLIWFTDAENVDRMQRGRRALESRNPSEEQKQALIAAFSLRARRLHEMVLLGKEFDRRAAEQGLTTAAS